MIKRASLLLPLLWAAAAQAAPPSVDALTPVTLTTTTGLGTSIAVDSQNTIHVVFYDPTDETVKYVSRVNGTPAWGAPAAIDSAAHVHSTGTAMTLAGTGSLRAVFYDKTDGALRYTRLAGSTWQTRSAVIDLIGSTNTFPALALNAAGNPRVLYNDWDNNITKYAVSNDDGITWSTITMTLLPMVGQGDVVVDAAGRAHVAMYLTDFLDNGVVYARETSANSRSFQGGGALTLFVGDGAAPRPGNVSLAVDSNNVGHLAAFNEFTGDLLYLRGTTETVSASDVLTTGWAGQSNDITLTSQGRPLIAYSVDGGGHNLATCGLALCDDASDWTHIALDATATAGAGVSLARNPLNSAFTAYFDGGAPNLRFATTASRGLTVSGTVRDAAAAPLAGVTMTFGGSIASVSTTTPAGGTYSFTDLFEGSYGVVPTFPGYGFQPEQGFFAGMIANQSLDFIGGPVGFDQVDNMIDPTVGETVSMTISVLDGGAFVGVYTLAGRPVKTLMNEFKSIGSYNLSWDGRNEEGEIVASGIYLVRVRSTGFKKVLKVAVVK